MDRVFADSSISQIYEDLKSKILSGQMAPGSRLIETAIARQYGASRLHVKSAFHQLATEQLAVHVERKGFFVQAVDDGLLREIIEIRQALELVVVRRVIKVATADDIANLQRMAGRVSLFIKNNMIEDGFDELNQLYAYLYEVCGYKRVVSILETYSDYISLIRHKSATSFEQHLEYMENLNRLVEAIADRDFDRAEEQIHLRHKYLIAEHLPGENV